MELSSPTPSHVVAAVTPTTIVKGGARLILTDAVATSLHIVQGSLVDSTTTFIYVHEWKWVVVECIILVREEAKPQ